MKCRVSRALLPGFCQMCEIGTSFTDQPPASCQRSLSGAPDRKGASWARNEVRERSIRRKTVGREPETRRGRGRRVTQKRRASSVRDSMPSFA
jgi:hypothetical protein